VDHVWLEHRDALLAEAAAGDRRAREAVVAAYLPLARSVAAWYGNLGLPFDDLVQEASLGVLEAIDTYDAKHGVDFAGYARFRARRAVRNALTERARLVRLPKHIVELRRLLERERAQMLAATGRPPTAEELAARVDLPVETVVTALEAAINAVSLDAPATLDGSPLEELVPDVVRRVDEAVERLPERQRRIIEHTFGFGEPQESIAEIAEEEHLSPQRTRTIVIDALQKLRDDLEAVVGGAIMSALGR
jgi:RNA polymerase sigma factor (sigma-70 family)